jgi:F-type H+-transporting ATPase subunit delta
VIENSIAKRYARALIAVAQDEKRVDEWGAELASFYEACLQTKGAFDVLGNRHLDLVARLRAIDQISAKLGLGVSVKNLLKLLLKKGRFDLLSVIVSEYGVIAHKVMGRIVMQVVSAMPLEASQYDDLQRHFSQVSGRKMVVKTVLNPTVLGGVRVHIGDQVYDYTIAKQMETLGNRMLGL